VDARPRFRNRYVTSAGAFGRRDFLRAGLVGVAAGTTTLWLGNRALAATPPGAPAAGSEQGFEAAATPALASLAALAAEDAQNGGAAPFPIPWLDKNGSLNQPPGPGQEPSNIFHFKGRIARANGFTGMGTDTRGRRIPFGTVTTDYSFMQGEYWAGRSERQGAFTHT
jgi:hypothetical protein